VQEFLVPITPSYPGLYIEELPASSHTITAAPTSIAVFIGYTHPYKTPLGNFGQPIRLFSFSDYEREFGGFFRSDVIPPDLPLAVSQFFLNGGSDAYVVALRAAYVVGGTVVGFADATNLPSLEIPTLPAGGIKLTAKELVGPVQMQAKVSNVRASPSLFDLTITYGSAPPETFRDLTLSTADPQEPLSTINKASRLVAAAPEQNGLGTAIDTAQPAKLSVTFPASTPAGTSGAWNPADFTAVFQADSPLDKVSIFNLLVLPRVVENSVQSAALAFAERKRAFVIFDPPQQSVPVKDSTKPWLIGIDEWKTGVISGSSPPMPESQNGALYFPYLSGTDPLTGEPIELGPSGYVAGIYARTDANRGVWKAPAGIETTILNTTGVVDRGDMTDQRHGVLNPLGINCIRIFPDSGPVVFGARTLVSGNSAFQQSWYIPVRRMTLFLEQTLIANLRWVVFEPNAEPLWTAIRISIESFMLSLFSQGALKGTKPSQAFQVKCDQFTTTDDDIVNGVVNIVVAFAPLRPAEFVVIKIAQLAGQQS